MDWRVILRLASKYKRQSHNVLPQRECKNKTVDAVDVGGGCSQNPPPPPFNCHQSEPDGESGISLCRMSRTFLLYSIQPMLNSCERLSATVAAKKVTLILSAIVLLQGLPAGNTEQTPGETEGGV